MTLDPTVTKGSDQQLGVGRSGSARSTRLLEIMESRAIYEQLYDIVGKPTHPARRRFGRDKAITRLSKDLTIWSPTESNVLCVSSVADTPERAQWTAVRIRQAIPGRASAGQQLIGLVYDFFAAETEDVQQQLQQQEALLEETKNQFGFASIDGRRSDPGRTNRSSSSSCAIRIAMH